MQLEFVIQGEWQNPSTPPHTPPPTPTYQHNIYSVSRNRKHDRFRMFFVHIKIVHLDQKGVGGHFKRIKENFSLKWYIILYAKIVIIA